VAPPYDVISPEEEAALLARSRYNSVRIELPADEPATDRYEAAAMRIAEWRAEGVLRHDPAASFYCYRMTYDNETGHRRQTVGVVGALQLEQPGRGGIFPHERTTPKAKSDRLQLLEATKVNTSPIWALSLAPGLSRALHEQTGHPDPVVDSDGVRHELWPVTDPAAIATISQTVASAPVVIADGHHRFETALTYQSRRLELAGEGPSGRQGLHGYDAVMAMVTELVEDELSVRAIHRLISGLPENFNLVRTWAPFFDVTPTDASDATILKRMEQAESLALVTVDGAWLLHPKSRRSSAAAAGQDLDSTRLEVALAALPHHDVVYQHGWDLAVGAVERGEAQAAVLLNPVTVEQIAATGRGGERMPPKSTFFWPKPKTGFVFREVAD
jgi:uncharacterized protein (DUF1015 family)